MVMITSKRADEGDAETAGVEESHKIQKCATGSSAHPTMCRKAHDLWL